MWVRRVMYESKWRNQQGICLKWVNKLARGTVGVRKKLEAGKRARNRRGQQVRKWMPGWDVLSSNTNPRGEDAEEEH